MIIENAVHSDPLFLASPKIKDGMLEFLKGQPVSVTKIDGPPSCGAAFRVKPRVRLCEPWVMVSHILRAAKWRQRKNLVLIRDRSCPFGARSLWMAHTQGSQSLAPGLTLSAAPQPGEWHAAY